MKTIYEKKVNPNIFKIAAVVVGIALLDRYQVIPLPTAVWHLTSLAVGMHAGLWLSDWAVEATKVHRI
jgi:hypothetical protein